MPVEEQTRQWTVLGLVDWATGHLTSLGFEDARLNVELLLGRVLALDRISLYLHFDRPLIPAELSAFKDLYRRRLNHEPLQYILGETQFMGFSLFLDRSVLIPRPETELLVEVALTCIKDFTETVSVLDIGTGSGNIPIAIAKFASNAEVTAIDVSAKALDVARMNIERNAASRITLVQADIFDEIFGGREFDVIVANPPYISCEEWKQLPAEIKDHEPHIATTDNRDGLTFLRRISEFASHHLKRRGWLLMEIAYNQAGDAVTIARERGLTALDTIVDYGGHPRILKARR